MYQALLFIHTYFRWLVLLSLLLATGRAGIGAAKGAVFTARDNALRHWTATIAHVQLLIGMVLYFQSPVVQYVLRGTDSSKGLDEPRFFAWIHAGMMLLAILVLSIGSALAKRRRSDRDKFRTMLLWFAAALFLILLAIPWPFAPFAQRAYIRTF